MSEAKSIPIGSEKILGFVFGAHLNYPYNNPCLETKLVFNMLSERGSK